jgi:hypothetical protein
MTVFLSILFSLIAGAFATSFVEYRLQYNLWDWLKDKVAALIGWERKEVLYVARVAKVKAQAFESELLKLPAELRAIIRRRF